METKEMNRPQTAPPPSAQQHNGAARTEEEQRSRSGQPPQAEAAVETAPRTAPKKRTAPARERTAAAKGKTAARSKAAPAKEKPARKAVKKPVKRKIRPEDQDLPNQKRSYGNSKPKKGASNAISEIYKQYTQKAEAKPQKKKRPKRPTPAVIYTQPAAFNRSRLMIQLLTATAIVAAMVLGLSVFFKVDTITVTGAGVYSAYSVEESSGIKKGDNLLTFSRPRAGAMIKANLPYVDTVRFGIKLPGTVNIIIKEDAVVYAIKDQVEAWWLINSDGRVVEPGTGSKAANHTQVLGVTLESPVPDSMGVATEVVPTQTDASGELMPVTTTNAQRLNAALTILQALEANDIVGAAASVDVSRLDDIILWYGTRYQVNLGDSSQLEYKIACMNDVILQMSDYQSGILDISFTVWPDQVGYTPFA